MHKGFNNWQDFSCLPVVVASGDRGVEDRGDLICTVLIFFFLKSGRTIFSRFLHNDSIYVKTLSVHSGG